MNDDDGRGSSSTEERTPTKGDTSVRPRAAASLPHLHTIPLCLGAANEYVSKLHRHNGPFDNRSFYRYSLGCATDDGRVVGVAIVGNPSSKVFEDGFTVELRRVVTDGTPNANSCLYGACVRAAKALGYRRAITYTLQSESGVSLRASGWKLDSIRPPRRVLVDAHTTAALKKGYKYPTEGLIRWVITF